MVLFLASLSDEEYEILLEIFHKFESCELKEQTLSRSQRQKINAGRIDCKGSYFKSLRGMAEDARKQVLDQVKNAEISLTELSSRCKYIKKMAEIQSSFMTIMDTPTWEAAQEAYPEHTKKERLEPFLDKVFKKNEIPPAFTEFCRQAKVQQLQVTDNTGTPSDVSKGSDDRVVIGNVSATIIKVDTLSIETKDILSLNIPRFTGLNLTVLDPPKVSYYIQGWI